jgi:hypothetical protein
MEELEDPEETKETQIQELYQVRGMSDELDNDNSVRTGIRQASESGVGSPLVEKKYNWALVLHSLRPSFNPREENSVQPVEEQNCCHEGFRGRSCLVIVPFMHFKNPLISFSQKFCFWRQRRGSSVTNCDIWPPRIS